MDSQFAVRMDGPVGVVLACWLELLREVIGLWGRGRVAIHVGLVSHDAPGRLTLVRII